jgi:two-component system, chemotaxis family, CheB/CheR fusion protein
MSHLPESPIFKIDDLDLGPTSSDPKYGSEPVFPVIGIGASAGGLQALNAFFEAATIDSGLAYTVVQHLDPTHESFMVDLLRKRTLISINLITNGMKIEPNNIYLIPPGKYLTIENRRFRLTNPEAGVHILLPFDTFLRSLAENWGEICGCVVLSGSGTDGTIGAKAIKQQGGLVVVQTPEEATFDNMPRSAIATGFVDAVLPAKLMPALISAYFKQKDTSFHPQYVEIDPAINATLEDIIIVLREKTGHDFHLYKTATLMRRLERRMVLNSIESPAAYLKMLRSKNDEAPALVSDLLINVTSFFRDSNYFDLLSENVISVLIEGAREEKPIRIWVAGCSSGEEVYSLVILFLEEASKTDRRVTLQIFATDIDPDALASARIGYYPKTIEADVSPERLERYFTKKGDGYQVNASLRQPITFAKHNILSDPPYSRLNLIVCRNVLIYIKSDAHKILFTLFQFSLVDHGYLFLGSSESLGSAAEQFDNISPNARIFRLTNRKINNFINLPSMGKALTDGLDHKYEHKLLPTKPIGIEELAHRAIFKKYAPAAIVVNSRRDAVFFDGPIDRYLKLAEGNLRFNVPTMAREGLGHAIRSVIQKVEGEHSAASISASVIGPNDEPTIVEIECLPLLNQSEDLVLLIFRDRPACDQHEDGPFEPSQQPALERITHEFEALRRDHEATIAKRDNELEIIAALQEEFLSMREEYQSTSEELETSKEELQSTNEELTTLNNHLKLSLDEQRVVSDDLQNILVASETATIILDGGLRLKLFTPTAMKFVNIRECDSGRSFSDFTVNISDESLYTDLISVLREHGVICRELLTTSGLWYSRKVFPYLTHSGHFGGLIITYSDITDIKVAEISARQANNAKSTFLATMSHELRTPLNSILGFAQVALEKNKITCQSPECKDYNSYILESGNHLLSLINDILDVSKIEAGKMTIHPERISFVAFTEHVEHILKCRAHDKSISIKAAISEGAEYVWADLRALKQLFYNLLANSIEFTPNGGRITIKSECAVNGGIDISVIDNGIGISSKDLLTLMVPFHQVDNSLNRKHGGSGLGLALVKGLIELHGGRVLITSIEGSGTSVMVHFPPEPIEPPCLPISIEGGAPPATPTVSSTALS